MKTFSVNNKKYTSVPFSFNMICEMEEMGISIGEIQHKQLSTIRAYLAICGKMDLERAGEELQSHMVSGKSFDELSEALTEELQESDFFLALKQGTTEETTENKSKASKKA